MLAGRKIWSRFPRLGQGIMRAFFIASTIAFGVANSGLAFAQTASGGMVHAPATNVDGGINAKGTSGQQSPAADINGTPVKLPPPQTQSSGSAQPDISGNTDNALTHSPKGPNSGGNDATK